jgi:cell division protease FtsH
MRDSSETIGQNHLSLAIDKVMLGEKSDRETTMEERIRVAYHELGHAITAEVVKSGSVSQVSLSPRGQALGFVRHNPQQDQYLYTKSFLEERIMIALGGSVAEEMFYGDRSTGSRNDFEQALQMVETMIDSGLTSLGIVNRAMVSKELLMRENNTIIDQLIERTRAHLEQYRYVFDQSLNILLKEEVLSGDEFRALMQAA